MSRRQGWAALALAMAAAGALLLWLQRDYTFVADEIIWIEWVATEPVSSLFAPYNGNLSVSTLLIARLLLGLFGTDYLPFGIVQIGGLWLCTAALYAYAARRIGYAAGLIPAVLIGFLGSGWAILLQPLIGTVFVYSLGFGLWALIALERGDRRGDAAACALLSAALTFYSAGIAFLVGAAVAIALAPGWRRRAWVVLVPAVLYGGWRIAAPFIAAPSYVPQVGGDLANLLRFPLYLVDSAALAGAALFGGIDSLAPGPATGLVLDGFSVGRLAGALGLLCLEVAVVAAVIVLMRRRGGQSRGIWVGLSMLAVLWLAQSYVLGEGRTAAESRYLFSGAFLLLIVLVEVAAAVRPPRGIALAAAALCLLCVYLNVDAMRAPHRLLRDYAQRARADMAMIELGGRRVDPAFTPTLLTGTVPFALYLTAGPWNEMAARYGSPAMTTAEVARQPERVREEADVVLASGIGLRSRPVPPAPRSCGAARLAPQALPPAGAVLRAPRPAFLVAALFADRPEAAVGAVGPGEPMLLRAPAGLAGRPWRVGTKPAVPLQVCPVFAG